MEVLYNFACYVGQLGEFPIFTSLSDLRAFLLSLPIKERLSYDSNPVYAHRKKSCTWIRDVRVHPYSGRVVLTKPLYARKKN